MKFRKRDYLLAPIYLYQAHQIKRTAISLPEPRGERIGTTTVQSAGQSLKLMIIGDSAGAGVGVVHQDDAALGRIIHHLSAHIADLPFGTIEWQLHATTGHTSLDILKNLQNINDAVIDYVIISVGVNDVVKKNKRGSMATSDYIDGADDRCQIWRKTGLLFKLTTDAADAVFALSAESLFGLSGEASGSTAISKL